MEQIGSIIERIFKQLPMHAELDSQGTGSRLQETSKQMQEHEPVTFAVSSKDADMYSGEPAPKPAICQYCGATLYYKGIKSLTGGNDVFMWFKEPDRCTCEQAKAYWQAYDEKIAAEKKAKEDREEARRMEMRVNKLFSNSGIRARFRNRTFDKFEVTPENRKAYGVAKRYADDFADRLPSKDKKGNIIPPKIERNGLLIVGSYGTGKTHLVTAIANQLITAGTPVIAMTMIDLLARIKRSYDDGDRVREDEVMSVYENIPLLIIDDIGSEQPTEWGVARIYAIFNSRYEAYMPTIITTNYGADELVRRLTPNTMGDRHNAEKIIDRLKEMCVGLEMYWESWRPK